MSYINNCDVRQMNESEHFFNLTLQSLRKIVLKYSDVRDPRFPLRRLIKNHFSIQDATTTLPCLASNRQHQHRTSTENLNVSIECLVFLEWIFRHQKINLDAARRWMTSTLFKALFPLIFFLLSHLLCKSKAIGEEKKNKISFIRISVEI